MPCSASTNSALRCVLTRVEATRTAGLRARNVRYSTIKMSRNLLRNNSSTLRNQRPRTSRISTLQPLQVSGYHATLSPVEDPRRRKEPSHRGRTGSMIGDDSPIRTHGDSGGVAQTATIPAKLRLRQDSTEFDGFSKPPPLPDNETSLDQDWLEENLKRQRGDAISRRSENPVREEHLGSSKHLGFGRKARLRDDSRTVEGGKGAMRSTWSTKASAESKNGTRTQNHKDQREPWQTQKSALSEKFGPTGWLPRKRLSPDTLDGIRALHSQYPDKFTTPVLADQFKVSPEAIRRILKSKWQPNDEEEERRRGRWEKRGENIWSQMVEVGIKPPKKWRDMGVGKSRERYFSVPLADRIF